MNRTVCFCIALFLLAAATAIAVARGRRMKKIPGTFLTPFRAVFAGVFLMTFVLLLPIFYDVCAGTQLRGLKAVLFAIQGTFQVFTIDADSTLILEHVGPSAGWIAPLYSTVISALFVLAPVFTFGFVASLFRNVSAYFRLGLYRGRDWYVFSELNDRSVTLAEDLRSRHGKDVIVFTDVFDNNEENSYELAECAEKIGAICLKGDLLTLRLKMHKTTAKLCLFAIGSDENENIAQALRILSEYGSVPDSHLFVFSAGTESELLLTHPGDVAMRVRRVSEVRSLIHLALYEHGSELFENAAPEEDGSRTVHAVVVGLGGFGTEMVKALTWYCQMDGYHIVIDAFDKDPLAEDRFTALCPELMSPDYNGVSVKGEAEYLIRIHSGADADTASFARQIASLGKVTYAFVSAGSDADNLRIAVNLRTTFERMRISPVIRAVIRNPEETEALRGAANYRGQPYRIDCIGDLVTSYSEEVILNSGLEADALKRHLKWGKEPEFWQFEYNYRSSMASAIHMRARIACGIPGADKAEEDLTEEEKAIIEPLEHRRWNAYMRSEGYVYSGSPLKSSRNDLGKMHHDLVDFSSLSEEEKRKDSRVGSK